MFLFSFNFPVLHMSRFLPFWFFFLGLGVLALLSRRGGWPFLLGKVLAIFWTGCCPFLFQFGVGPSCRVGPPFPVGVGLLSRVKVGPSGRGWPGPKGEGQPKKGRNGRPGAQPKGKEGEGPGPILKGKAMPDPRAKEAWKLGLGPSFLGSGLGPSSFGLWLFRLCVVFIRNLNNNHTMLIFPTVGENKTGIGPWGWGSPFLLRVWGWLFGLGPFGVGPSFSWVGVWPFLLLGGGWPIRVGVGQGRTQKRGKPGPARKGGMGRPGAQPKGKEGEGPSLTQE